MAFSNGTFTFFFTDIEGSTRLWEQHPKAMQQALARHDALLQEAIARHAGEVFKTIGDAFCAVFASAAAALATALEAQRALQQENWGAVGAIRVRMAIHTGEAEARDGDYFGPTLNRIARLLAIGHGGQVLLSATTHTLLDGNLPEGVHLADSGSHLLKDLQQPEHIYQLRHPDLPGDFPPLRSLHAFANNLPVQVTSFVGRERELAEVIRLLSGTRLLTLTGMGGTGKTRLALQAAADLIETYGDGVRLVELAPLADLALVPQTIAQSLGLREEPGHPLTQTLTDYLRAKELLLVLDNCEHLLTACARIVNDLMRACPRVKILATSREVLGVTGEQVYRVPTLSLPNLDSLPPANELEQYEAVRLFTDRARAHQPAFALSPSNAPALAQVCHRLDGIPLAIELAAARVRALPVEQIAARLDDRFRLLTGGARTALPRQQTLRALMDWSYELLNQAEQTLFRRLAVFAGGWTLEAAEQVCAGECIEEWEILDLLTGLADKSLVLYEAQENGVGRYRLLETVRQYAQEKLSVEESETDIRRQHRDYFLALAQRAKPEMTGPDQTTWMNIVEAEHDNLRSVLHACQTEAEGAETLVKIAEALAWFWYVRGYLSEGREWIDAALARSEGSEVSLRARLSYQAGILAHAQMDYASAQAHYERCLELARTVENKKYTAWALVNLGAIAVEQGDAEQGLAYSQESLVLFRELGLEMGIAGNLRLLGNVELVRQDYAAARDYSTEHLALARRIGDEHGIAYALSGIGSASRHLGDLAEARTRFRESLTVCRRLRQQDLVASCLNDMADIVNTEGDAPRAARLLGAAEAIHTSLGMTILPVDQPIYEAIVHSVRSALGEAAFKREWEAGRTLTWEEAIDMALC